MKRGILILVMLGAQIAVAQKNGIDQNEREAPATDLNVRELAFRERLCSTIWGWKNSQGTEFDVAFTEGGRMLSRWFANAHYRIVSDRRIVVTRDDGTTVELEFTENIDRFHGVTSDKKIEVQGEPVTERKKVGWR